MRLLYSLLVTGCLLRVGWCLMGGTAFSEFFKPRCFAPVKDSRQLKMGQQLPAGFTMSGFLDKLELLEQKLAERDNGKTTTAVDMAVYMMRMFYHSDYDWEKLGIKDNADIQRSIVHHVMANLGRPSIAPDQLLEDQPRKDDDICFLMFSLAHNVNKSLVRNDRFDMYSETSDIRQKAREEGVLSVTGSKNSPVVAIGRTLLGIAAAHTDVQKTSVRDVLNKLKNEEEVNVEATDGIINPIPAVTIAAVVAQAALKWGRSELQSTMGMRGEWLEHGCFLEYRLKDDTNTSATLAELTGAIDGFILGKALTEFQELRNWNLSTVLRLYYSPRGIVTGSANTLSHCRRQDLFGKYEQEGRTQVEHFARVLAYKGLIVDKDRENMAKTLAEGAWAIAKSKLGDANRGTFSGEVCPSIMSEDQPECETPTDLLIVLDTATDIINNDAKRPLQSEIIAAITKSIKFQSGISSVSVFASKRNSDVLRDIISNSAAGGCPGCAALYLRDLTDISAVGADSDQDVFNMLNSVVTKHISLTDERPGVASRVVLYLNMKKSANGGAHGNNRQVEEALIRFRLAHPDVPIFAAGFKEVIDKLNTNTAALRLVDLTNVLSEEIPNVDNIVNNNEINGLAKKICQVPATLRHKYCLAGDSRARSPAKFMGAVTTKAVQYWSYSTASFSASKNLQIKFTTNDQGNIKVCDLTGRVIDGDFMGMRCQETNANFKTLTFNYTRPCKKGPSSCSPLTYAVIGKDDNIPQINFDTSTCEGFCRNPQQIKFQVEHQGMVCAGVLSAMFSPLTLLITALALLRHWMS